MWYLNNHSADFPSFLKGCVSLFFGSLKAIMHVKFFAFLAGAFLFFCILEVVFMLIHASESTLSK